MQPPSCYFFLDWFLFGILEKYGSMATIRQRLKRFNGTDYDTIHLETEKSAIVDMDTSGSLTAADVINIMGAYGESGYSYPVDNISVSDIFVMSRPAQALSNNNPLSTYEETIQISVPFTISSVILNCTLEGNVHATSYSRVKEGGVTYYEEVTTNGNYSYQYASTKITVDSSATQQYTKQFNTSVHEWDSDGNNNTTTYTTFVQYSWIFSIPDTLDRLVITAKMWDQNGYRLLEVPTCKWGFGLSDITLKLFA